MDRMSLWRDVAGLSRCSTGQLQLINSWSIGILGILVTAQMHCSSRQDLLVHCRYSWILYILMTRHAPTGLFNFISLSLIVLTHTYLADSTVHLSLHSIILQVCVICTPFPRSSCQHAYYTVCRASLALPVMHT